MSSDKYAQLYEKYPVIFQRVKYVECGQGWFNLLDTLCDFITGQVKYSGCDPVVVTQIKEKFGGLRFYYTGGNERIAGAALFAERLSEVICETCGAPGTIDADSGWLRCRCDNCKDL